jgi:bifunctional UDP-N-acetylglucosamine pyrophosphorylase/glucosamine-1-phosphate N-acetyltransferase
MDNKKIKFLILAAGKGTRMNSDLPKVLAPLGGKPMIKHLIETISKVYDDKPIIIVGYKAELVKAELGDSCIYALQKEQLGTGHAVFSAKDYCEDAEEIVVLSGDQPFVKAETIKKTIEKHESSKAKITFTTTEIPDFLDWRKYFIPLGRILRENEEVVGIREYKDASEEEKEIKEINTACCYVFDAKWLWENIPKIKNNNAKNEFYITDLFYIASEEKENIETVKMSPEESMGANSKEDLEILQKFTA